MLPIYCFLVSFSQGFWEGLWAGTLIPLTWPSYLTQTSAIYVGMKEVCQKRGANENTTLHVGSASLESEDLTACLPTMRGNDVSLDSLPPTKQW